MRTEARILVTGAGGFVGGWLLDLMEEQRSASAKVVAITGRTPTSRSANRECDCRALDIRDARSVDQLIAETRPTAVLHLAAISAVGQAANDTESAWTVNVSGTRLLAEAVQRHVPEARFVYVSSAEVYGGSFNDGLLPLTENALLDPVNVYSATKAAADLLVGQMAHQGFNAVRLRPFNHTGPRQSDRFVVGSFASKIAQMEAGLAPPVLTVGNLDAERDFTDVRDIVRAYSTALRADCILAPGVTINLASGVSRRIGDILETLCSMAKVPIAVNQDRSLLRQSDTPRTLGDASRARALLGWAPKVQWEDTLRDMLDGFRAMFA